MCSRKEHCASTLLGQEQSDKTPGPSPLTVLSKKLSRNDALSIGRILPSNIASSVASTPASPHSVALHAAAASRLLARQGVQEGGWAQECFTHYQSMIWTTESVLRVPRFAAGTKPPEMNDVTLVPPSNASCLWPRSLRAQTCLRLRWTGQRDRSLSREEKPRDRLRWGAKRSRPSGCARVVVRGPDPPVAVRTDTLSRKQRQPEQVAVSLTPR